jgi:hypothetical protein
MKVAIYACVSTKGKGQSVNNQLPDLRAYAQVCGYTLCKKIIYNDLTREESGGTASSLSSSSPTPTSSASAWCYFGASTASAVRVRYLRSST